MFAALRTNPSDGDVITTEASNIPASTCAANTLPGSMIGGVGEEDNYLTWHLMGEYTGPVESVLPREFRQRLHKHFARIEREFEREYRRLYSENLALQERLEKFEDGDHSETITLVKKLGASMLSQRIKQQYKQSTSRLVSSLRQSTGHSSSNMSQGYAHCVSQQGGTPTTLAGVGITSNSLSTTVNNSLNYSGNITSPNTNIAGQGTAVYAGTFPGHNGSFQLMSRIAGHRDGIWEVTSFRRFIATASADNTARLWINDAQLNCLLVYVGHSGSVNSVRFRNKDSLMLTSSGDGAAHLIRLPFDLISKAASSLTAGNSSGASLDAVASALAEEVAGTGAMSLGISTGSAAVNKPGLESGYTNDLDEAVNLPVGPADEGSPVRVAAVPPITVRHPHAIFQSANLYLSSSGAVWNSVGASGCSTIDSSPLSAADFVSGREQLVTASWDRLGRTYDLATGQELDSLTGHDDYLTDVRCEPSGSAVVVTSSRDCTFRLWDFRQPGMRVHVQQAHSQTVSTTQFLTPGSPERLISAGADKFCRLWDLRQSRVPVVSIRTDAAINRLSLSGYGLNLSSQPTESNIPISPGAAGSSSNEAQYPSSIPSQAASQHGSSLATSFPNSWTSNFPKYIALPLVNRGIKLFDVNGNRIGRLTRSSHGHSRMVTCVSWANEGVHNFFSTGFDGLLLAWQIHIANI